MNRHRDARRAGRACGAVFVCVSKLVGNSTAEEKRPRNRILAYARAYATEYVARAVRNDEVSHGRLTQTEMGDVVNEVIAQVLDWIRGGPGSPVEPGDPQPGKTMLKEATKLTLEKLRSAQRRGTRTHRGKRQILSINSVPPESLGEETGFEERVLLQAAIEDTLSKMEGRIRVIYEMKADGKSGKEIGDVLGLDENRVSELWGKFKLELERILEQGS